MPVLAPCTQKEGVVLLTARTPYVVMDLGSEAKKETQIVKKIACQGSHAKHVEERYQPT